MARAGFIFGGEGLPQTQEELEVLRRQMNLYYRPRVPKDVGEGLVALGDGLATGIQKAMAAGRMKAGQDFASSEFGALSGLLGLGGGANAPPPPAPGGILSGGNDTPAPTVTAGLFSPTAPALPTTPQQTPAAPPSGPQRAPSSAMVPTSRGDESAPQGVGGAYPTAPTPDGKTIYYFPQGEGSILSYMNDGAVRNHPIRTTLAERIKEAIGAVYGPGYRVGVYSGGQPERGSGGDRVGSVRHDGGRAADIYVMGPDGKRLRGDALALLGQYWAAKRYGGVGMEMAGGGVHLDEWEKPPPGGGMAWNYARRGGQYTPAMRAAIEAGLGGTLPQLYAAAGGANPPVIQASASGGLPPSVAAFAPTPAPSLPSAPAPRPDVADDLARRFLNGGPVLRSMGATAARIAAGNQAAPRSAEDMNAAFQALGMPPRAPQPAVPPEMPPAPMPGASFPMPEPRPEPMASDLPVAPMAPPPQMAPQMAPPQGVPADPAATAFLTGRPPAPPPQGDMPALPQMPNIALPPVVTGVPQVNVPAPRLNDAALARASALMGNPFLPPGQRALIQGAVEDEMRRRDPGYAAKLQAQAMETELKRRQLMGAVSPAEMAKLQLDIYSRQLEAAKADPRYMSAADRERIELDRKRLELEVKKADPSYMTAADRARIGLDRDKFEYEKNKPITLPGSSRLVGPDGRIIADTAPGADNPTSVQEYEYARRQGYMGSLSEFMAEQKRAGATTINNTGERAFEKETGTALAKRFDALATDGDQAANDLQVLGSLREQLTKVPTGFTAVMQQWAGSVGIKTDGSSSVEVVNALINRLTPQQRVPGSGATSDFDAKMFRDSLPSLMNTPEGNRKIMEVMEGLAQNRLARADIATRVQIGEITPKDALAELRALQAQARAMSDQFKPANQRKGEAPAPATPGTVPVAPSGPTELTPAMLDEIRRKYGGQ